MLKYFKFALIAVCGLGLNAVSPLYVSSPAHAVCSLVSTGGVVIDCQDDFNATLLFQEVPDTLTLTQGEESVTVPGGEVDAANSLVLNANDSSSQLTGSSILADESVVPFLVSEGGQDTLDIIEGTLNGGFLSTGGVDVLNFSGGIVNGSFASNGTNTVNISGGVINGQIGGDIFGIGALGTYTYNITGGTVNGPVLGGNFADTVNMSGGTLFGGLSTLGGDDNINISGTADINGVAAGAGDDIVVFDGGDVAGFDGGTGFDAITVNQGDILGPIVNFEDITIDFTGTIGTPGTLDIVGNNAQFRMINTQDIVNGVPFISSLTGINQAVFENSSLEGYSGTLGINELSLLNGSSLGIAGSATLVGSSGSGQLTVNNSALDFINGSASDTLTVSDIQFINGTLGIDVNPISVGLADQVIVTNGTAGFQSSGQNIVLVNFTEAPDPTVTRQIPILGVNTGTGVISDDGTSETVFAQTGNVLAENFVAVAVGQNATPLVQLNVLDTAGGLVLETTEVEAFVPPPAAVNVSQALAAGEVVADVNNDLVDGLLGIAPAGGRVAVTPTFGIFANGQFGRMNHDGFDVSGAGFDLNTPSFTADSFSLIGVAELDASAEFGLTDNDVGLKFSTFGGYVENDVTFSRNLGNGAVTRFRGDGNNTGGAFGGTVLASQLQGEGNLNYGLFSSAWFFGETDVTNADTGGVGNYNTTGQVYSIKIGRNMPIADRIRLDVRGGASYQMFRGTSFVDSTGVQFGSSVTSFGVLSFEPGLSSAFKVGDFVVSPSVRALVQQRVGYRNEATISGIDFDFDDSDFTVGGQLGAAVKFTDNLSGGAFIEGRFSEDYDQILGKLAIKYTIPRS